MFPLFVTDTNDDAYEEIKSLPGQARYGVRKLCEYLKPYVQGEGCLPLKCELSASRRTL